MSKVKIFFFFLLIYLSISQTYYPACSSSYLTFVDGLKSIGVDSSFSNRKEIALLNGYSSYSGTATENNSLLNLCKSGKLISNKNSENQIQTSQTKNQETSNNSNGNEMIDKLVKNSVVNKDKKDTIKIIGNLLFEKGYEPAFVAGVLGNVHSEASIGRFESSNYKSNPSAEPQYLKYMDELYNYNTLYSGKSIIDVSLSKLNIIIEKLYNDNWCLGKPFFKKYEIVFDFDNLQIGLYTKIINDNESSKDESGNKNIFLIVSISVIAVLIIIIGLLIFWLIKCYINSPRKKRANELIDDNYEYNNEVKESEAIIND